MISKLRSEWASSKPLFALAGVLDRVAASATPKITPELMIED